MLSVGLGEAGRALQQYVEKLLESGNIGTMSLFWLAESDMRCSLAHRLPYKEG